jgi:transglutaminase-like putative cysteine protease
MSYTVGNWTVASLTTDTISTAKTPSVPDLSYSSDYTVIEDEPTQARLANITGSGLTPVEYLRYGRTSVNDVYTSFDVPASQQLPNKRGIRTLQEVRYVLKATNSVSGAEVLLPMRGWICLEAPTADIVAPAALTELLMRTISASFGTGKTDGSQAISVARGDLIPA